MATPPETKAEAEALLPRFQVDKVLNQDQSGRRISIVGTIDFQPALIVLERAALPIEPDLVTVILGTLTNTTNLGANDIYRWYLSNRTSYPPAIPIGTTLTSTTSSSPVPTIPDLKLNLIYPCTEQHIRKYSAQRVRQVKETSTIYQQHISPFISRQRQSGRLDWIYNILDGRTEQEDVLSRVDWDSPSDDGFLLLPDLNWDRKTVTGMHLLALPQRRDLHSLRSLKKSHVPWLKTMHAHITEAATKVFPGQVDQDEIKCYIHYQPTYYHFHVHVVHVMLEAGTTQSVGKAIGLGSVISWLESLGTNGHGDDAETSDPGLDTVDLEYWVGEENDLWKKCFGKLKNGEEVDLNN
ncbi:hypothetical protein PV10_04838 [Exophiala mesophila]|uniref:Scavenger mRNA-decapping enzyme DcpS n=1 Tax=Exophiala mesophila TaxID=212818 RepID=A0A0D1WW91_EXOME|nr:uncharacterized protein PV10_04838 [Exophiala mesophila]KIV93640.1 hypothetical protein PV10_04838 [Exophiala mesophila]